MVKAYLQIAWQWFRSLKRWQQIFLISIIILMLLSFLITSSSPASEITQPSRFNPTNPTPPPPPSKRALIHQLPHLEPHFTIQYLSHIDTFIITILLPPYETAVIDAHDWLASKGVTPGNSNITVSYPRFAPESN
jgi:hypothetical protein